MNPQELFCLNEFCRSRGVIGAGNVIVPSQKPPRCKCNTCGKTLTPSKGTAFYRVQLKERFRIVVTLLAFGCPPQAIVRAFDLDERTVFAWLKRAGEQAERVHDALITGHPRDLEQVQADEIRAKLQRRLLVWMAMAMQVSTRLWLGGVLSARRDRKLIERVVAKGKACALFARLLLVADGLASYVHAFKKAFRSSVWTGRRGRPKLIAWPVIIGQVIQKKQNGRLVGVLQKLVEGTIEEARTMLTTAQINTAYIERLNAPFRARLCTLVRRGRALARQTATLQAGM
jgi:transposase